MSQNHPPAAQAIDPTKKSSLFEVPFRARLDFDVDEKAYYGTCQKQENFAHFGP